MKEGDRDIFENFEVDKVFIYLTCGSDWSSHEQHILIVTLVFMVEEWMTYKFYLL